MKPPEDFDRPPLKIEEEGTAFPIEKFTRKARSMPAPTEASSGRMPPQAVDIEKAVLGAALISPEAVPRAIELLTPEAFYDSRHQKIFQAIVTLFERNHPVDIITLTEELRRWGVLETIGGPYYLTELTASVASAANVDYHARIIAEKYLLRRLIATMTHLAGQAYDPGTDAFELLDQAEQEIFRISESELRKPASSLKEVVKQTIRRMHDLQGREGLTGIPSGFHALDDLTGGWQPSDLIIVAARPSMGKTAFALSLARNAALHREYGTGVAIFSLEMSAEQLAQRLLTSEARVSAQLARTGKLRDEDWKKLAYAAGRLSEASIFIDDTPGISVLELRAKSRRLKAEHDIGLIVVDYLQLMQGSRDARNREQEIAHISRSLKALAKELNVPVIALSQLSRAVETRGGDKRPQLSDLRESGCLTGDTRITLTDGRRVPIRTLVGKTGFTVWALDPETYRLQPARVSRAFSTGIKPVFRLTTRLGRNIRATANHRFLTPEGWKRVDELRVGDYLALPRRIPEPVTSTLSHEEVALLGHLIGDGCTLPRHTIQYTTCEEALAQHVVQLVEQVFGASISSRIKKERNWYQVYLTSTEQLAPGRRNPISEWLHELGIFGLRSYEKRVPERVFQQNSETIAVFLRHLWTTDGCIQMRGGKRPYPALYYATSSRTLAEDVQSLLLRLDINARLRPVHQRKKGRLQYHVILSGKEEILRFLDTVGVVGSKRQETVDAIRRFFDKREGNTNRDIIPRALWIDPVRAALNDQAISHRAFQKALGMSYCGSTLFLNNVSRSRARRMAEVAHAPELQILAQSDVYWDPVVSIEPDGIEEVFDLTVPGPHNFVANEIIAHNSIEQDADVVVFIYRAERYGILTDEQGHSTEGIAEIIVGKQRNGPIGSIKLAFVKEYARFENLSSFYANVEPGYTEPGTMMQPPEPEF